MMISNDNDDNEDSNDDNEDDNDNEGDNTLSPAFKKTIYATT